MYWLLLQIHKLLQFGRIQRYKAKVRENPDYGKSKEARTDRFLGCIVLTVIVAVTCPPLIIPVIGGFALWNHIENNR
jgi:hypothetical protein